MAWKQGLGATYQGYHANLNALTGVAAAANKLPYFTSGSAMGLITLGGFADDILAATDQANAKSILGLTIGSNVQAWSGALDYLAGLTYGNFADDLLAASSQANARSILGLDTGNSPSFTSLTLSAQAGNLAMNNNKITGLATPTGNADAATKAYVDGVAQGLHIKDAVKVATTANITLSGAQTIDGVPVVAADRVLVKNQTTGSENGIYVASATGWSRASDMAAASSAASDFVFVQQGSTYADYGFVCTNNAGTDVVGTDALTFTQFSGAGSITAGDGLAQSGNTLSVNVDASSIEISSDTLRVKAGGITNAMITASAGIPYSKLTLTNSLVAGDYMAGSVDTAALADASITAAKLAAAVAGNGLSGGAGTALAVNVDNSSIEISSDTLQVKAGGITNAMIAAAAGIPYSKLSLGSSILSTDLAAGALGGGLNATLALTSTTGLTNSGGLLETGIQTVASGDTSASVTVTKRWVLMKNIADCEVTLPAATVGQVISFKKEGATGNCTLNRAGSDTIDGAASVVMSTQYAGLTLACLEAAKWSIL